MHTQRAIALSLLTALLAFAAALPGSADTMASPGAMAPHGAMAPAVPLGSQLIQVNDCNPSLNLMQTAPMYAGYAPGYYGRYGGYWPDVYGARYYQPATTTANPEVAIHYKNISPKSMTEIEFGLVVNDTLRAEVRDVGTFSPGAEIKHRFGLSSNAFPIQGIPHCYPLHITFADGTKWRNPKLPPKNPHIYSNGP